MLDIAQPLLFPFLMSMCLMAISSEFFENDLPRPLLLSVVTVEEVFRVLREVTSETFEILLGSGASALCCCPLPPLKRPFPCVSAMSLPLVTTGDEFLLVMGPLGSGLAFAAAGLDLPADTGLPGRVVLRLGGVSREKSGNTIGCCVVVVVVVRTLGGPGELGLDSEGAVRPFVAEVDGLRCVGVEGREFGLEATMFGEFDCLLEVGVDGLELREGLALSKDGVDDTGRILDGVEARDREVVRVGVGVLAEDEERELGDEGLM